MLQEPTSKRRLEYMITGNGIRFGPEVHCNHSLARAESWIRVLVNCHYCLCRCVEEDDDKLVSLREVLSNIEQK